jgi:hypothetical protein
MVPTSVLVRVALILDPFLKNDLCFTITFYFFLYCIGYYWVVGCWLLVVGCWLLVMIVP